MPIVKKLRRICNRCCKKFVPTGPSNRVCYPCQDRDRYLAVIKRTEVSRLKYKCLNTNNTNK